MEENVEIHAMVKGFVQGVGFRATARHYATKHGIKGTIRNLADGGVEIYAQGNKHTLDKFFQHLLESFGDYVEIIDKQPISPKQYDDFHILR